MGTGSPYSDSSVGIRRYRRKPEEDQQVGDKKHGRISHYRGPCAGSPSEGAANVWVPRAGG
eukprot:1944680-Alexandrium_andersonii.AAC.1